MAKPLLEPGDVCAFNYYSKDGDDFGSLRGFTLVVQSILGECSYPVRVNTGGRDIISVYKHEEMIPYG